MSKRRKSSIRIGDHSIVISFVTRFSGNIHLMQALGVALLVVGSSLAVVGGWQAGSRQGQLGTLQQPTTPIT